MLPWIMVSPKPVVDHSFLPQGGGDDDDDDDDGLLGTPELHSGPKSLH